MARTLLVADRDRDFSELLQTFLTDRGFQVDTALSGIDCVDKMRRLKPDAVVLDLDLLWGGADGVINWMREDSLASDIPVIMTATATSDAVDNVSFPIIKLLPKPFPLAELLRQIHAAVEARDAAEQRDYDRTFARSEMYFG